MTKRTSIAIQWEGSKFYDLPVCYDDEERVQEGIEIGVMNFTGDIKAIEFIKRELNGTVTFIEVDGETYPVEIDLGRSKR